MKNPQTTINGDIKSIDFQEFLTMVRVMEVKEDLITITQQDKLKVSEYFKIEDGTDFDVHYSRRAILLTEHKYEANLIADLLSQVYLYEPWLDGEEVLLENSVIQSLENFGDPAVRVLLGSNLFLVTNPEDFMLYINGEKKYLAALAPHKSVLYRPLAITEKEARKIT